MYWEFNFYLILKAGSGNLVLPGNILGSWLNDFLKVPEVPGPNSHAGKLALWSFSLPPHISPGDNLMSPNSSGKAENPSHEKKAHKARLSLKVQKHFLFKGYYPSLFFWQNARVFYRYEFSIIFQTKQNQDTDFF